MPEPYYEGGDDYDPFDSPRADIEILGRGPEARKSKTFIKDIELATLLGFIRGHTRRLTEAFRRLHSLHFQVEVTDEEGLPVHVRHPLRDRNGKILYEVDENSNKKFDDNDRPIPRLGDLVPKMAPHVLSDDEVRRLYPVVAEWERLHQEQVDHYASIEGFSVIRATGRPGEAEERAERVGSSAGSERRHGRGGKGSEPRWE